ncbi:hypothetical protein VKT23_020793 [Stygiomarasmius scandens]|uniref:Uncharacterized protein n=1 Tax=Marasmiellus scandens TaxID=2682957 RepID=A0ABR1J502_9AGAR
MGKSKSPEILLEECLRRFPELATDQNYVLGANSTQNFTSDQEKWIRTHFWKQYHPLYTQGSGLKASGFDPPRTLVEAEKMFKTAKQHQFAEKFPAQERKQGWDGHLRSKWKNMKHTNDGKPNNQNLSSPDIAALFAAGDQRVYTRKLHQQDYNSRHTGEKAADLNAGAKLEWDAMSPEEQSVWQVKADALRNRKAKEGLTQETLYRTQTEALASLKVLLESLIGYSSGQIGDAQFYCMVAYHGEGDVLKSACLEAGANSFEHYLEDAKLQSNLRGCWETFAQAHLQRNLPKLHETKFTRSEGGNQYILPRYDEESPTKTYRRDVERFLEASWCLVCPPSSTVPIYPRTEVLVSPEKFFRDPLAQNIRISLDSVGDITLTSLLGFAEAIIDFQRSNPEISIFRDQDELITALTPAESEPITVDDITDFNNPESIIVSLDIPPRRDNSRSPVSAVRTQMTSTSQSSTTVDSSTSPQRGISSELPRSLALSGVDTSATPMENISPQLPQSFTSNGVDISSASRSAPSSFPLIQVYDGSDGPSVGETPAFSTVAAPQVPNTPDPSPDHGLTLPKEDPKQPSTQSEDSLLLEQHLLDGHSDTIMDVDTSAPTNPKGQAQRTWNRGAGRGKGGRGGRGGAGRSGGGQKYHDPAANIDTAKRPCDSAEDAGPRKKTRVETTESAVDSGPRRSERAKRPQDRSGANQITGSPAHRRKK